ncbi:MAG: hypothetical protein OEZ08_09685 [Betaproteobacteria bacterium]|nr:hypothetical protein [Betaproteobacteria bacterium]
MHLPSPKLYADAQFIEGWMRGTYVVAGIFAIPVDTLSVSTLSANIAALYDGTKRAKRAWWPRGISGMFLFPFYLGSGFSPEVVSWVQRRHPYRWAIWHEPVLYDTGQHSVTMRGDYGLFGSAFYPLVGVLYVRAMQAISLGLGREFPDFINGCPTAGRPAEAGAAPNGGPAPLLGDSGGTKGPPPVS